jgi:hypothetical protein
MFREWGKNLAEFLKIAGIDVFHFVTIGFILIALFNYKEIKNWRKLKLDRKLWIGSIIYGLIILVTISLLRIFGVLYVDY